MTEQDYFDLIHPIMEVCGYALYEGFGEEAYCMVEDYKEKICEVAEKSLSAAYDFGHEEASLPSGAKSFSLVAAEINAWPPERTEL